MRLEIEKVPDGCSLALLGGVNFTASPVHVDLLLSRADAARVRDALTDFLDGPKTAVLPAAEVQRIASEQAAVCPECEGPESECYCNSVPLTPLGLDHNDAPFVMSGTGGGA